MGALPGDRKEAFREQKPPCRERNTIPRGRAAQPAGTCQPNFTAMADADCLRQGERNGERLSWCDQNGTDRCEQKRTNPQNPTLAVALQFTRIILGGASAEEKALRGRNLSAV